MAENSNFEQMTEDSDKSSWQTLDVESLTHPEPCEHELDPADTYGVGSSGANDRSLSLTDSDNSSFMLGKFDLNSSFISTDGQKSEWFEDKNIFQPTEDQKGHSNIVMAKHMNLRPKSDVSEKLSSSEETSDCQTCEDVAESMPSKDSMDFWNKIPKGKSCHQKSWKHLIGQFCCEFSDDIKKDKTTLNFLKAMLGLPLSEEVATVELTTFLRVVKSFGPVRKENGGCVVLQQLATLRKNSIMEIERKKVSWFAFRMTRSEAEERLHNQRNWTYLVRMSESNADLGHFVVSVVEDHSCHHFEIENNPDGAVNMATFQGLLKHNGREFPDLASVIKYIHSNPICIPENGDRVFCRFICPNLPQQNAIVGYTKLKKKK